MNNLTKKIINEKKQRTKGKLRLSYTLMSLWEQGRIDLAVANYFHLDTKVSKAMLDGRKIHKEIENHIKQHNTLPKYLPQIKLKDPTPEQKIIAPYSDKFELTTIIDCMDEPNLLEFKTGKTDSNVWAETKQLPLAFLITEIMQMDANKAYVLHYNQHMNEKDFTIVWKSERMLNEISNYIDSMGAEIYQFFKEQKYL